jgi:hypothetical protein
VLPRHRRRGRVVAVASVVTGTPPALPMADSRIRRARLVTGVAFTAGRASSGRYVTVCGVTMFAVI